MDAFEKTLKLVVFALLLCVPVFLVCFRIDGGVVQDPDVWWHLRTADWIVAHSAVPHFDPFSYLGPAGESEIRGEDEVRKPGDDATAKRGAASLEHRTPWVEYNWAADLVLGALRSTLGLRGLIVYTALGTWLIVLVFHVMVRSMQRNLLLSVILTLAAIVGIQPSTTPRPFLFSILFFVIELYLLLEAGRTKRPGLLLLLIPLFCVWANVHIQFIYGLLVLAAAVAEPLLVRWVPLASDDESAAVSPRWLLLVFLLCCGAVLLNPYGVRLYITAWQVRNVAWDNIAELKAMPFRSIANWTVLAAALAGAGAIASRRPLRLLLVLLFLPAAFCSFHTQRDSWLVLFVGLSLVANMSRGLHLAPKPLTVGDRWGVAAVLAALVLACLFTLDETRLEGQVAKSFPAKAIAFLRQSSYDGPMYNLYEWGGYLEDQYPEHPVCIDGRSLIHGVARFVHSGRMQSGEEGWQRDPELTAARLFILPRKVALTLLLRLDKRFDVVYDDDVTVVFVRR